MTSATEYLFTASPTKHFRRLLLTCVIYTIAACGGGGDDDDSGTSDNDNTQVTTSIPDASLPLSPGKKWLYDFERNITSVCSTCGVNTKNFIGEAILHVEGETNWQGRQAWRIVRYELETNPGGDNAFAVEVEYLVQDSDGLERWYEGLTRWKRILSAHNRSFGGNTLLMTREPNSSSTTTLTRSSVTVPAGSYSAVRANAKYRKGFTSFASVDHDEDHSEYYADGVGLVRSTWDFWFDDNDPAALDVFETGTAALKAIDNGPFPELATDTEPNNTALLPQALSRDYAIVSGRVHIGDLGGIVFDNNVAQNINGQRKIEDWYRFDHPGGSFRLDMRSRAFANNQFNDLDVYLFLRQLSGSLVYVNSSRKDPVTEGSSELITDSLNAGTYFVGIQAWNTPTTETEYWFIIR